MSQVSALESTIDALDLRPEHEALKAFCLGLAAAVDADPGRASLWREYRPAVELLLSVGEVEDDDGQARLLSLVSTPVGDSKKAG